MRSPPPPASCRRRPWFLLLLAACAYAPRGSIASPASASLADDIQKVIDGITSRTGYAISVGYVDADLDFGLASGSRTPPGLRQVAPGNARPADTFAFGSGSKPSSAAAVLRLMEQGKLKLDDKASKYIDPVIAQHQQRRGRTSPVSLVGYFGPKAAAVTVRHLITMQSGINDFDVPDIDFELLETNPSQVHPPIALLDVVANTDLVKQPFACDPGTCTCYSSTNYVLIGYVLQYFTAPTSPGATYGDWWAVRQSDFLGIETGPGAARYPDMYFANKGALNSATNGLTTAGASTQYGIDELWSQDASVLGWTCGNIVASAHSVARFYWDLLGPVHDGSILERGTVNTIMRKWSVLSVGWAKGWVPYGAGLMLQNVSPRNNTTPMAPGNNYYRDEIASYVGHGGDTYAFMSDNGYFPNLEAAISVVVNQDVDWQYPAYVATCQVIQVVAKAKGLPHDLGCAKVPDVLTYACVSVFDQPGCLFSHIVTANNWTHNLVSAVTSPTLDACSAVCHSASSAPESKSASADAADGSDTPLIAGLSITTIAVVGSLAALFFMLLGFVIFWCQARFRRRRAGTGDGALLDGNHVADAEADAAIFISNNLHRSSVDENDEDTAGGGSHSTFVSL